MRRRMRHARKPLPRTPRTAHMTRAVGVASALLLILTAVIAPSALSSGGSDGPSTEEVEPASALVATGAAATAAITGPTSPASASTTADRRVLAATADTYANTQAPDRTHGDRKWSYATTSVNRSFLKFDTAGAVPEGQHLVGATIRLYTLFVATTKAGLTAHPTTNSWAESTLTANSRPKYDGRELSDQVSVPGAGQWVSIPLEDLSTISATGRTSFELLHTVSGTGFQFATREGGRAPVLELRFAPDTSSPDPTASPTSSPTATPTSTPTASPTPTPTKTPVPDGVLPFDMPSPTQLDQSPRMAFAHYFPPYPVSIDNKEPSVDYYERGYLDPDGENGKHSAYGGLLRDRPLPRPPVSSGFEAADFEREVRQAIAGGLDGFTVDILGLSGRNWDRIIALLQAANRVDPTFEIMLMPDMSTLDDESPAALASAMATLAKYPAAFRLDDGRLVISPFKAEGQSADWWKSWMSRMDSSYGIDVAFVPTFLDWKKYAPSFAPISYGISAWGVRNPDSNQNAVQNAETVHNMGKLWMAPVSVQDVRPNQGIYEEAGNTETLRITWNGAIDGKAEWVHIPTWNDYSEGTQLAPSAQHGWTYLDLTSYYVTKWKTGTAPKIVRDTVYVTHRTQPYAAMPTYDQTKLMQLRSGTTPPRDTVEALTFLTAPAKVRLSVGSTVTTYDAPAGVFAKVVPLKAGTVSVEVVRDGSTTTSVTSPYTVTTKPYVQDLQYHGVSSRR